MSEQEIPPIKVEQTEISDYLLGRGAKVIRTVEISDDAGMVWGYKVWYENAAGEHLTLLLERVGP
jgi:hypothetical protein